MAKIMNLVFGIGIAVIIFIVALLGIQAFYPQAQYDDFCNESIYTKPIPTSSIYDCNRNITVNECLTQIESKQQENFAESDAKMQACNEQYNSSMKNYNKYYLIIASILGLLLIIAGYLLMNILSLGSGMAISGIVLICVAFTRGWNSTDDILKFVLGLIIAAVVVYLTMKVNAKFEEKKN